MGIAWINANLGRRAFVSALDAQSGAEVWRWYTTKEDGWEGDYAATFGTLPTWGYSSDWGYGPGGIVGLLLIVVIVLALAN